jgi:membrane-associated phospholipid phosphatase
LQSAAGKIASGQNNGEFFVKGRRTLWIWLISIGLGIVILLGAFYLDPVVHDWMRAHRVKNIKALSRNVTRATDWPTHVAGGLLLAGVAWWRGNKKWSRIFLAMVMAAVLAGASAYAVKVATGRVRPSVQVEKAWSGPELRQNFQSFPSGHTAVSTGFFALLLFVNWRLALLLLPLPLFVACSRIFLGAHYLSDVVGGALLGLLCAAIVAQFFLFRIEGTKIP